MVAGGGDRFRFSGLEMAVIAASFVVTAVLVFILGFYVGRDVASRHLGPGPLTARVPVGPAEENGGLVRQPTQVVPVPEAPVPEPNLVKDGDNRGYTVQVRATRSRKEAESMAAELIERGVDAFVVVAEEGDARWYRVRVGRFEEMAEARAMAERCRHDFGLEQAYATPR